MKKLLNIILITILFIPIMVNAAECDTSKVYIDSIVIDGQKGSALESETATVKDKTINMNLEMFEVNDSVKYKIIIKNDSNEDYELDEKSIKTTSEYIDYSIESDGSNIIKARTTKTVYVNVQYKNPVPDSAYVNGSVNDTVTMKVDLSSDEKVQNPNTGIKYYLIIAIIIITIGLLSILLKKKKITITTIIVGILLIPLGVSALCKCQIEVKSVVLIKKPIYNGTIVRSSSTDLKIGDTITFSNIKCKTRSTCNYIDENEFKTKRFYIKHEISNNVITSSYVCTDNVCLRGATTTDFETNKELFFSLYAHSQEHCTITDERVYNSGTHDYIESNGNVRLGSYCGECKVNADGSSSCSGLDRDMC